MSTTPAKARRIPWRLILVGATALLLMLVELLGRYPQVSTPFERTDLAVRDVLMRIRGAQEPAGDIVIVAIDDFSFNWTGYQWPWPRTYLAEIVGYLNDAGARLIGVDVFLFEPDDDPAGDPALSAALADSQAAVTVAQIFRDPAQSTITLKLPLSPYRDGLDGIGLTPVVLDEDAIARSLQAFDTYDNIYFFNWAFEIVRLDLGIDAPADVSMDGLTFNGTSIPLTDGLMMVDFAGPAGTYPTYSAAKVVLGDYPAEAFRDKIVLIGATTLTLQDVYPTPFSARVRTPGVEIVANAVDTLRNGRFLRASPPWVNLTIILAAALIAGLISRSRRPSMTVIMLGAAMLIYALAAYLVYRQAGVYLAFLGPELMLFLGVVLPTLEQAVSQELEKRRVRGLFARFLSPEMVDQIISTQDISSLNKRANLTVLFSDIRGFTTLSEKLSPEEVVALLNPYLEAMTEVIYRHGGTVDKYEGDAIIAFYGEPVAYADHALRAVRTSVDMRVELSRLRERWQAEGRLPQTFEIGIGLNSGEAFVGLLGSAQRINYTVIGDNVNLAARLQDQTKYIGWPILISESTYEMVKDEFDCEFASAEVLKGKTTPVRIYKVLGRKGAPASERVGPLQK